MSNEPTEPVVSGDGSPAVVGAPAPAPGAETVVVVPGVVADENVLAAPAEDTDALRDEVEQLRREVEAEKFRQVLVADSANDEYARRQLVSERDRLRAELDAMRAAAAAQPESELVSDPNIIATAEAKATEALRINEESAVESRRVAEEAAAREAGVPTAQEIADAQTAASAEVVTTAAPVAPARRGR